MNRHGKQVDRSMANKTKKQYEIPIMDVVKMEKDDIVLCSDGGSGGGFVIKDPIDEGFGQLQ